MECIIKKQRDEILQRYYELVYPLNLKDNEYIKIHLSKIDAEGKRIEFDRFVRGFEEYREIIEKYRYNYNIYNELATIRGDPKEGKLNGQEKNLFRRQVLYLDYDKKDYPKLGEDVYQFTRMIKEKLPDLFIHAMYNSGGGFHFYISVDQTEKQRKITTLNKRIAELVGADSNACKVTQIARVPTTYNCKPQRKTGDGKYPLMLEIDHYQKHPNQVRKYHPLDIDNLIRKVQKSKEKSTQEEIQELPRQEWEYGFDGYDVKQYSCLCTEKVFREGAEKGERNAWLGRILVWLRRKGTTTAQISRLCLEWNARCRPPKPKQEFVDEIDGWNSWFSQYGMSKIGGCWWMVKDDSRVREMIQRQCDKLHCKQANDPYTSMGLSEKAGVRMSQKVLSQGKLSSKGRYQFSGYEYLVLTVLDKYLSGTGRKTLTIRELKRLMQYKKSDQWKLCMDIATFKKTLQMLETHKCIVLRDPPNKKYQMKRSVYDDKVIRLARGMKDMEQKGYVEFYYAAARAMIFRQITQRDYKVYLCIVNNLKNHSSCTLENLDKTLNMGQRNISGSVQKLETAHLLQVDKVYSDETGNIYNRYTLTDTCKWNQVTCLEEETDSYIR